MTDAPAQGPPPYIHQAWSLLTEFDHPGQYLLPEQFRDRPQATSGADGQPWVAIGDRDDLIFNRLDLPEIGQVDAQRLAITTDAGIGKSVAVEWLLGRFNQSDADCFAASYELRELVNHSRSHITRWLLEDLAERWSRAIDSPTFDKAAALEMLEGFRRSGRLVLLLDSLDQAGDHVDALEPLLDPQWNPGRVILTGRPHALQQHWEQLFAGRPWKYVRAEPFNSAQQKQYLGASRYDFLLKNAPEAEQILHVPRVLSYLRSLPAEKLSGIKTAADVYHQALQQMLVKAMEGKPETHIIGCDPGDSTGAMEVLSAIAFEMTSSRTQRVMSDGNTISAPSFHIPSEELTLVDFRKRLRKRCKLLETEGDFDRNWSALYYLNNRVLNHGLFEPGRNTLDQVQFSNRSLQEFLTAYYLAKHALPDDVARLGDWTYQQDQPASDEYYYVWQYLCEMPLATGEGPRWLRAIEPLYRPAEQINGQWVAKRSNEMIFRSWPKLSNYCNSKTGVGCQARQVRDRFLGEFASLATRDAETAKIVAAFKDNFLKLPGDTFQMGSPPEKQGGATQDFQPIFQHVAENPESIDQVLDLIANARTYLPGSRGEAERAAYRQQWQRSLELGWESFQAQALRDETPLEALQSIDGFLLARSPLSNACYRLFDPGHGRRESRLWPKYGDYSPDNDCPAIYLTWFDAWAFCLWAHWDGESCRLPWENEWEYAAKFRVSWDQNYWWGESMDPTKCNMADSENGSALPPHPARASEQTKAVDPHSLGLMDLLGNVWEWCQDVYRAAYQRDELDNPGAASASRVLRGGSFFNNASACRSASRNHRLPTNTFQFSGVRVARALPPL